MPNASIELRDLALASGLFAAHAPALISGVRPPPAAALLEYSRLVRQLLKHWWRALEIPVTDNAAAALASLAEEVLVSELTCRVVAGVFAVCDARGVRRTAGPFARSALLDLMQAKHSVLSRLVQGPQPLGAMLRINQLRRKTERWCDCLLGGLPDSHLAEPFAVNAERMRAFARRTTGGASQAAQYLTLVSLRLAMPASIIHDAERCHTHRELMRSLIGFWPVEAFDSEGLLRGPLWQRLRGLTDAPVAESVLCVVPSPKDELQVLHRRWRPRAPLNDEDEPSGGLFSA